MSVEDLGELIYVAAVAQHGASPWMAHAALYAAEIFKEMEEFRRMQGRRLPDETDHEFAARFEAWRKDYKPYLDWKTQKKAGTA